MSRSQICLGPVCIPIYALLPALFLLLKKLWDKCFGRKGCELASICLFRFVTFSLVLCRGSAPTRASSSAADGEVSQPVRSKERKSLVPEGDGKVQIPADDDEAEAQLTAAADRIVSLRPESAWHCIFL